MTKLKNDKNKKHYFSEVEPSELTEICGKIIEEEIEIKAWEQGKSDKEVETFIPKTYSADDRILEISLGGGLLSKLSSSKLLDKDIFIKIGSDKFQFFSTSILEYNKDTKTYFIVLSRSLFKTQQRTNYRLQSSTYIRIQFRIDADTLKEGLDISAGGTSFIVPKEEASLYQKNHIFKDCKLGLNSEKFNIPSAKVAATWPAKNASDEPTGELNVGIAFEDLTPETEELLFRYINGEARADEMRKMMDKRKKDKEK